MMIEHFILAKESSIDSERNSLSVFDFIEDIDIRSPNPESQVGIAMTAICVLKRTHEVGALTGSAIFNVLSPDGKAIMNQDLSFNFAQEHKRVRLRINFGIRLSQSGEYRFRIESSDHDFKRELSIQIRRLGILERVPSPK